MAALPQYVSMRGQGLLSGCSPPVHQHEGPETAQRLLSPCTPARVAREWPVAALSQYISMRGQGLPSGCSPLVHQHKGPETALSLYISMRGHGLPSGCFLPVHQHQGPGIRSIVLWSGFLSNHHFPIYLFYFYFMSHLLGHLSINSR